MSGPKTEKAAPGALGVLAIFDMLPRNPNQRKGSHLQSDYWKKGLFILLLEEGVSTLSVNGPPPPDLQSEY